MVKTSGAMFSTDARGSIGPLTYQHIYRRKIVRSKPIPRNPRSSAQLIVRKAVAFAVSVWQWLHEDEKAEWRANYDARGNRGYAYFMSTFVTRTLSNDFQYQLPEPYGFCVVGDNLVGEFSVGGTWLDPAGGTI